LFSVFLIASDRLVRINQIVYTPINNYSFVCLLLLPSCPVGQVLILFAPANDSPAIVSAAAWHFSFGVRPQIIGDGEYRICSFISGSRHSHVETLFLETVCEKSFTKQMILKLAG